MKRYFNTPIGRLRTIGFLEGSSLLFLLFIAVPVKYFLGNPALVRSVGMLHGILFLMFVGYTLVLSVEHRWSFFRTTWKLLLASIVPFGTFYVDRKILSRIPQDEQAVGSRQV